jgi:hypothetical protein
MVDASTQYALAYALTTSAGLRGVLTLAAVSLAVHIGWLHPPAGFAWLGATSVTIALWAIALLDFAGDKIPVVDHALHALNVIVKPACAAILVGGTVHAQSEGALIALMALGVLNALGVHAASATIRGTSTVTTAGIANPAISVLEDAGSITMVVIAFVAPFVAAAVAIVLTIVVVSLARRILAGLRAHPSA